MPDNVVRLNRGTGRPAGAIGRNGHIEHASMNLHEIAAKLVGLHAMITDQHKAVSALLHDTDASLRLARTHYDTPEQLRKAA